LRRAGSSAISKNAVAAFERALGSWQARQIISQEIPEKPPAPALEVRHLEVVDALEENCVAIAQLVAGLPAQRFRVQFAHDSAVMDGHASDMLDASAGAARRAEIETIYVEGHADRSGASQYNLALSMQRVLAVWDQLIARGISPYKIWLGPRGEGMPETITRNGEKNRRKPPGHHSVGGAFSRRSDFGRNLHRFSAHVGRDILKAT
jgi:outer membrane protein OmpA-like peptidoglycan-associated protein